VRRRRYREKPEPNRAAFLGTETHGIFVRISFSTKPVVNAAKKVASRRNCTDSNNLGDRRGFEIGQAGAGGVGLGTPGAQGSESILVLTFDRSLKRSSLPISVRYGRLRQGPKNAQFGCRIATLAKARRQSARPTKGFATGPSNHEAGPSLPWASKEGWLGLRGLARHHRD